MYKRDFKTKGMIPISTYLKTYKVGDIVDIKANAAIQKGMPHKYYRKRSFSIVLAGFLNGLLTRCVCTALSIALVG